MQDYLTQNDFNHYPKSEKKRKMNRFFVCAFVTAGLYLIFGTSILNANIDIKKEFSANGKLEPVWVKSFANLLYNNRVSLNYVDPNYIMPDKETNRLDVLILGIRGENDKDADLGGALLTDTMMIFSHNYLTKKSSLVSIPRDLYVKIYNKEDKINAAYEYGLLRKEGNNYVKRLISQISGVYIDNVVIIDFSSFEKLVDQVGGIDIILPKPFKEETQWGYAFELPVGENHLDGEKALYYVRSRYSTTDFDRASRQQQVLFALKDKISQLNIITNPVKILSVINTLSQNIKTDINIWNIKEIIDLVGEIDTSTGKFKKFILSTDNLLYQTSTANGIYILLPQGDNFEQIKILFQNILK